MKNGPWLHRKIHTFYISTVNREYLGLEFIMSWDKKWNESGFRPPLCTYRLNWARRTSWGWWDDWDDTVLQTQDSKFESWRSETEHATSRSRRLPTILTFTRGWGRNIFCFFQTAETGNRTPNSGVKGSGANHYPRAPAHVMGQQTWKYWVRMYYIGLEFKNGLWALVTDMLDYRDGLGPLVTDMLDHRDIIWSLLTTRLWWGNIATSDWYARL